MLYECTLQDFASESLILKLYQLLYLFLSVLLVFFFDID
jgi:hypothetical protein